MEKKGYVYILFSRRNGTLYTGVTSDLKRRVYEHKTKLHPNSFSAKYDVDKLGYYEEYVSVKEAIEREKQIKGGSRAAKLALIEGDESTVGRFVLLIIVSSLDCFVPRNDAKRRQQKRRHLAVTPFHFYAKRIP